MRKMFSHSEVWKGRDWEIASRMLRPFREEARQPARVALTLRQLGSLRDYFVLGQEMHSWPASKLARKRLQYTGSVSFAIAGCVHHLLQWNLMNLEFSLLTFDFPQTLSQKNIRKIVFQKSGFENKFSTWIFISHPSTKYVQFSQSKVQKVECDVLNYSCDDINYTYRRRTTCSKRWCYI